MDRIFTSRNFQFISFLYFLILALVFRNDPFFGDAISSTSRAVHHIYEQNFHTIFYPTDADPAHPTLYSWLMAVAWKLFGRSLTVSHFYCLGWLMVLTVMFRKLARLFLADETMVNKATLLVFAMPTFLTQGAMMINTPAAIACFFAALYGLFTKNNRWFIAGASLMMLLHLLGSFFLLGLACTDYWMNRKEVPLGKWFRARFLCYFIPFAVFCCWLALHYHYRGWLVHSPHYTDADELNGPRQFLVSLLIMGWRLVDFGMLPFYLVLAYAVLKRTGTGLLKETWLILTGVLCVFMAVFLSKTIGHRYFLGQALLVILVVVNTLQHFRPKQQQLLYGILLLSLIAGNFLYYPGKNIGDGTLAYRSYFDIAASIRSDFKDTITFYSHAPLANPAYLTSLQGPGTDIQRIDGKDLQTLPAVMRSNLNAEFSQEDDDLLTTQFYGKSYENGVVYVNVFLNPQFYSKPSGWKLREPGTAENWMKEMKSKWKKE